MRPRLLDLFCGGGGAAVGYHRAGFDVTGVDIAPQPRYPFEFIRADALLVLKSWQDHDRAWGPFGAIHASPPCQDHSRLNPGAVDHGTGWLLAESHRLLTATGLPWVLENVVGSGVAEQPDLFGANGLLLCGFMFGLPLYRHRLFEVGFPVAAPHHPRHLTPASKAGHWKPGTIVSVAGNCHPIALARKAMGIDWTTRNELAEAIPPAFTEYIGRHLLDAVGQSAGPRAPKLRQNAAMPSSRPSTASLTTEATGE